MRNMRINPRHAACHRRTAETQQKKKEEAEDARENENKRKEENREGWLCQDWLWVWVTWSTSTVKRQPPVPVCQNLRLEN